MEVRSRQDAKSVCIKRRHGAMSAGEVLEEDCFVCYVKAVALIGLRGCGRGGKRRRGGRSPVASALSKIGFIRAAVGCVCAVGLSRAMCVLAMWLKAAIGVDEAAVKTALRHVCAQDKGVRCVECLDSCEILTGAYISTLAHEAENTARERGRITFAELSSNFRLPIHVTEEFVSTWTHDPSYGTIKLVNGALMTKSYELGKRAALCAKCRTATEPLSVEELMRACDLCEEEEEMVLELLRDLTKSDELQGSVTGVCPRQYLPDSFVDAQHQAAYNFFAVNGYLDRATAAQMQVRKLHAFVKEKYPRAECLETVVVSRRAVEQLDAVADEAVAQGSWFEAWEAVPTILTETDAAHLVGKCAGCKRPEEDPLKIHQLSGVYGVSTRFIEDMVKRFGEDTASTANSAALENGGHGSEMDLPRSNSSSRKASGKSRSRNAWRKAENEVTEEEVCAFVCLCKPELKDHPLLVAALGTHLRRPFSEAKTSAIRRASEANAGNFHERVDAFESTFEKMHLSFQLHCRGVQALRQARRRHALPGRHLSNASNASHASRDPGPVGSTAEVDTSRSDTTVDEPDPGDQAEAYLLETKGAELAEIVTSRECQKLGIPFAAQDRAEGRGPERRPAITMEACSALKEVLPLDVGGALASLWQVAINGGQLSSFCSILEDKVLPASNLVGRRLDKRRERQLVAEGQRAIKERLFKAVSDQDVLHYATLLVFQNATGGYIFLPQPLPQPLEVRQDREEFWSRELLNAIRGDISSEAEQCLGNLQREMEATANAISSGEVQGERATSSDGNIAATSALPPDRTPTAHTPDESGAQRDEGGDRAVRLLRSMEAVRALGLACGD
eukprot:jgi/Undpi1/10273/HiC_scaffold_28.g12725.m1